MASESSNQRPSSSVVAPRPCVSLNGARTVRSERRSTYVRTDSGSTARIFIATASASARRLASGWSLVNSVPMSSVAASRALNMSGGSW